MVSSAYGVTDRADVSEREGVDGDLVGRGSG